MGHRFARDHLVAHGGVVDEGRFDRCGLLEVGRLEALVNILVRVVGAGFIVERILNELEAGKADGVEGDMIGAAHAAHGDGRDAEVLQWRDPLRKMGPTAALSWR